MSNADTRQSDASGHRLADLLEQLSDRLATDRDAEVEQLLNEYPQFAGRLRVLLPAMRLLANVGKFEHSTLRAPGIESFADGVNSDMNNCQISEFRILREIGRGGMGVVYEAEQLSLGRRVALKVLPMAGSLDPQTLLRFQNEARAVAGLHHPHIVPVYAVGNDKGIHFYAMQLIDGQSLADVISDLRKLAENLRQSDATHREEGSPGFSESMQSTSVGLKAEWLNPEKKLGREYLQQVARWGIQAAVGLHYAHETGIVHRDIKPSNLMITPQGHLWITDFGLAMTSVDSDLTLTGDILGTLRYMSPEQTRGSRQLLDQRTDVYALGMTLYELLTLEPAYCEMNRAELLRQIEQTDPCPLRKRNPSIPVELQTIVMKAVDRDPALRYQTTRALADDLERWLADLPILARPSGWVHRATKWSLRNRTIMGASFIAMLLCVIVLMVSAILIIRERNVAREAARSEADHRRITVLERDEARYNLYVADMNLAHHSWKGGNIGRMVELLERHVPPAGEIDLRGWEWHYLTALSKRHVKTIPQGPGMVFGMDWSPDGRFLARGGEEVTIWDDEAQRESFTIKETRRFAWSPDGQSLATASNHGVIRLWNPVTGKELRTLGESWAADPGLSWAPDGTHLATGDQSGNIHIWNTETGGESVKLHEKLSKIRAVAWSPDGRSLAAAGNDVAGGFEIWDPVEHRLLRSVPAHDHYIQCLAWSPDGRLLATGSNDQFVKVWDTTTWATTFSQHEHFGRVNDLEWSSDGRYLVSCSDDSTVIVWEPAASRMVNRLRGHQSQVKSIAWSVRTNQVASAGADRVIRVYEPLESQEARPLVGRGLVDWSPDGQQLVTNGFSDGIAVILEAANGRILRELRIDEADRFQGISWSPNGNRIALTGPGGKIRLWDLNLGREVWRVTNAHTQTSGKVEIRSLAFSPNGRSLATAGTDRILKFWDTDTGRMVHSIAIHNTQAPIGSIAWNPDGRTIAAKDWLQRVRLWNTATWQLEREWQAPAAPGRVADAGRAIAWSPDGKRLAAGTSLGRIVIWEIATGRELLSIRGHTSNVGAIGWSHDGKRLASGSDDHTMKIWDPDTGRELLSFDGDGARVSRVAWSPNESQLAFVGAALFVRDAEWSTSLNYKKAK